MQGHPAPVDDSQEKQLDALMKIILPDRAASRALAPAAAARAACVVGLLKAHTSSMALEQRDKCLAVNCKVRIQEEREKQTEEEK